MRAVSWVGWVAIGLLGLGCQSDDTSGTAGMGGEVCDVEAPTACPSDMPTYADVEPIFQERCTVCHRGQGEDKSELCPGCWALTDYGHVVSWAAEIRTAMLDCAMPPEGSGITMTNAERMKILEWIRCDTPE